ncbi:MAG TPA: nucleotide exchange factor GrpE [Verrucomicrobia bacterium]|nr:nucleotide exchange factor GrpE [Verrucomicrobiota bacterium]
MSDDLSVDEIGECSEVSWKDAVLADFKAWLDALPDDEPLPGDEDAEQVEDADLLSLVGEMTALRQEVKLMSRGTGKLSRTVEQVSQDVSTNVVPLADEIRRLDREARTSETRGVLSPLLLELGDLREGLREVTSKTSLLVRPWYLPQRRWASLGIVRQREDLDVLVRRIDSTLERHAVKPIAAEAMPFDARCMTAEGVTRSGRVSPGHVSTVVKQGFSVAGGILRPAHVMVEE